MSSALYLQSQKMDTELNYHLLSQQQYQQFSDQAMVNIVAVDENLTIVYANAAEFAFTGYTAAEYIGQPLTRFYQEGSALQNLIELLQANLPLNGVEAKVLCKNNTVKCLLVDSKTYTDGGGVTYTYLFSKDITVYKKNEDLLWYLNTVAEELGRTRDTRSALNKISKLIVPKFANWFTIEVVNNGQLDLLLLEHEDPEQIKWAHEYRRHYPTSLDDDTGAALVIKTGKPSFVPVITTAMITAAITEPVKQEAILKMNLQSVITVAIFNKEVVTGVVSFISTVNGKYYDETDLQFAQNFAGHIGLALDNARLNEEAVAEINRRIQAEEELKKSEQLFRQMAEGMPQKMFLTDAAGKQSYLNPQWEEFLGVPLDELHGGAILKVIHPDDVDKNMALWHQALQTGQGFTYEHRFLNKEGEYVWHLTRVLPVKDDEGNIVRWLGTLTDIEYQKRKEEQKDEFISIASHELRTPLTSVKAFIQLAQKATPTTERASALIGKAATQIDRLERLISDLLDVSKINAGKMVYDMYGFDLDEALREVVETVQHTTNTHQLVIESSAQATCVGDRLRIEQVINNFLTNAIKYSPEGDKVIIRSEINGDNFIVAVQDFGIGIANENMDELFNRFYRVDNTAMRFQGLGLGLFISAEIIKRHNGSFWIESEIGKGSTFYFLLPLKGRQMFFDTETDGQTYYKGNFITIKYNPQNHWLDVDWLGYQNFESVKKGCLIILDLLEKNKCTKVLNDNSHVLGSWSEAVDWGSEVWFPAMQKAGLQYFAWIQSPSTFSRMSAQRSVDVVMDKITTQFFTDVPQAAAWLAAK